MHIYQLDYILHDPEESEGWMYLAEVPALQGCMAWGDTPEKTLDELTAVARAPIQSRKERGVPLPPEVAPLVTGKGSLTVAA
jgi:predicted RNase H-like HicB family nuclease